MAPKGRSPRVDIKGTQSVDKAAKQAEGALTRLQNHSKESFGHLTKHALGYGAALIGGAGVVGGLEATVEASLEAEKSQAKLDAQLKAVGISYKAHAKEIDAVVAKTSGLTGFMDKDLNGALANIVRSTGSLSKGFKLLGLATDVARAKNIDVASAGQMVGRVYAGNVRVLKSLGIAMDPVTAAQDKLKESTKHATDEQKRAAVAADKTATSHKALGLLQQKLGGQAKAFGGTTAGSIAKFHAAVDGLEAKLGGALAPTIADAATKAAKFVTQMRDGTGAGGRFADKMHQVAIDVGHVLGPVKDVAVWLGKHPHLLELAAAAWIAYKVAAVGQIAIVKAASLGLFGTSMKTKLASEAESAGTGTGKAFASKAGLAAAAGIGGWEIGKWLRANVPAVRDAGDAIGKQLGQAIFGGSDLQDKVDKVIGKLKDAETQFTTTLPNAVGNAVGKGTTALGGTQKKPSGKKRSGDVAHGHAASAHSARASAASAGPVATAAGSTGSYALANLVAAKFGLTISSGYRSPEHNAAIGGAPGSWHTRGTVSNPGAIDLVGSMGAMQAALAWVQANVPGLAEAMIDNYAGLGNNLHIAGPGLMNWNGHAASSGPSAGSGSPASSGAATSSGSTPSRPVGPPKIPVFKAPPLPSIGQNPALKNIYDSGIYNAWYAKQHPDKPVKTQVDRTLSNPWLTAALGHVDNMVAAGLISEADGSARKTQILNGALNAPKGLVGEDRLVAQGMIRSFAPAAPEDTGVADENARLSDIDLHLRAGDITEQQAHDQKVASIDDALANWQGLSDPARLELRAERGDLLKENTQSVDDLAQAMKDLKASIDAQKANSDAILSTSFDAAIKALADVISGQIAGVGYSGRALTAGAGSVARF